MAWRLRTGVSPIKRVVREGSRDRIYRGSQSHNRIARLSLRAPVFPELAAELVRLNVEMIQASGDFAPKVAQKATSTIPILLAFTDDVLGADSCLQFVATGR